jgi:hypothetical protein
MPVSDRWLAGIAVALGLFVVGSEIRFWGTGSELWPVLTALGLGLAAAGAAHFVRK